MSARDRWRGLPRWGRITIVVVVVFIVIGAIGSPFSPPEDDTETSDNEDVEPNETPAARELPEAPADTSSPPSDAPATTVDPATQPPTTEQPAPTTEPAATTLPPTTAAVLTSASGTGTDVATIRIPVGAVIDLTARYSGDGANFVVYPWCGNTEGFALANELLGTLWEAPDVSMTKRYAGNLCPDGADSIAVEADPGVTWQVTVTTAPTTAAVLTSASGTGTDVATIRIPVGAVIDLTARYSGDGANFVVYPWCGNTEGFALANELLGTLWEAPDVSMTKRYAGNLCPDGADSIAVEADPGVTWQVTVR